MTEICKRKIWYNQEERNNLQMYTKWWRDLIYKFEEDVRVSYIPKILTEASISDLSRKVNNIVLKMLGIVKETDTSEVDMRSVRTTSSILGSFDSLEPQASHADDRKSIISTKSYHIKRRDTKNVRLMLKRQFDFGDALQPNPYWKFYKLSEKKAAIWRDVKPLLFDDMDLESRAEVITNRIAQEFVDWLNQFEIKTALNVKSIAEMFNVKKDMNAFCTVDLAELNSVPDQVAATAGYPKKSFKSVFRRELRKDIHASKVSKKLVAFGRRLSPRSQVRPIQDCYASKWVTCDRVPENLKSMATVWSGITHLTSTKEFCRFMYEKHPEIQPPTFLVESNMMDPLVYGKRSSLHLKDTDD